MRPGDLAIDATAGNGHDTVFLAGKVGDTGRVLAFDIQADAIASAQARIEAAGLADRVEFIHGSHAGLDRHARPGTVAAVVFNLGYLPGGDHTVITCRDETLSALDRVLPLLRAGGLLAVVCYPGHPGGAEESEAVEAWAGGMDPEWYATGIVRREGTLRPAPFLVLVKKLRG